MSGHVPPGEGGCVSGCASCFGGLAFLVVLLVSLPIAGCRGITLVQLHGNDEKWWSVPPSLSAFDPLEREAAAREAARKYGGKP